MTEGLRPKNQQKTTFQVIQILSTRERTFTLKCIRELQIETTGVTIYPPEWLKLTIKDCQCQVGKNVGYGYSNTLLQGVVLHYLKKS